MDNLELTEDPSILLALEIPITDIKLYGLKLHDSCFLIRIHDVDSITLEKPPDGAIQLQGVDGKNFLYYINGVELQFSFEKRFEAVMEFGGCLHMKTGVTYVIDDKQIIGMRIYSDKHNFYKTIPKEKIEKVFGKADKIFPSYFEQDGSLASTEFTYYNRPISISVSGSVNKISTIYLGKYPFEISWMKNNG